MNTNSPTSKLTLEQQFTIADFNLKVDSMNLEQAKDFCKLLFKTNIEQKNSYCELLKHQWGIGSGEPDKRTTEGQ